MKRENDRTDIASRKQYPKSQLLRFIVKEGRLLLDPNGELPGRGYYLKKDIASLELALKKKAFQRILHRPLDEEEIARLKEAL